MRKIGVSSIIAVVLIIMIVVVSIAIIWMAVLPMVMKTVSIGCTDVDLSIGSEGYTCYSPDSLTAVQVKKGPNNVDIFGVKIGLSSSGNSISYFTDYKFQPNTQKTFYLNSSTLSSIDKISLVAIYNDGKNRLECPSVYMENALTKRCDLSTVVGSGALIIQPNGTCVANCSCANQTIIGQNCTDNLCGMNCTGTKCVPSCSQNTSYAFGQSFFGTCGVDCVGTKQDGSLNFPFVITNWTDLNNTRKNLVANYSLMTSLSSATSDYSGIGDSWVPIGGCGIDNICKNTQVQYGADDVIFFGNFNGNGNTISDLKINLPSISGVGLFGYSWGNISNLGLINVNARGLNTVGGLVGQSGSVLFNSYSTGIVNGSSNVGGLVGNNLGKIYNSYSTGIVNGSSNVGGLVGQAYSSGKIFDSHSSAVVFGKSTSSEYVGGLVGNHIGSANSHGINNSYATGNVTSLGSYVGGLVGQIGNGIFNKNYATGNVTGVSNVGGLVGYTSGTEGHIINNSYATGNVSATTSDYAGATIGGFVGKNDGARIYNSYSIGIVTGKLPGSPYASVYVGGFAGSNGASISNTNFWDTITSGRSNSAGNAVGKNTAQMQTSATFSSWDTNVWNLQDGSYPTLK